MADSTPITTATAKIVIEPDLSKWDEAKAKIEGEIDGISDKFKAAFMLQLDDFGAKIAAEIAKLEAARGGGGSESQPQSAERSQAIPDQALAKLTEIIENTERTAKAVEDLRDAQVTT